MADTCGDCKYYEKSGCSYPNKYDGDHKACSDFKRK